MPAIITVGADYAMSASPVLVGPVEPRTYRYCVVPEALVPGPDGTKPICEVAPGDAV